MPFRKGSDEASPPENDEPLDPKSLPEGDPEVEIESLIIPVVQDLHSKYIRTVEAKGHA